MGRLRTSFVSAMDYTKELINAGESKSSAVHKAALKFNEDEGQIKSRMAKEEAKKPVKTTSKRKPRQSKKTTDQNWVAYVGPMYQQNNAGVQFVSVKAHATQDNKNTVESLIVSQGNQAIEIRDADWRNYSRTFAEESKCDRFITRKSFGNLFQSFVENATTATPTTETKPEEPKQYKVNEKCAEMIQGFSKKKNKQFQDYLMLKTFGNDGVSPLRMKDIMKQIPNDELMYAQGEMETQEDLSACLKWRLRGLSIEDAVQKIKVDKAAKNR